MESATQSPLCSIFEENIGCYRMMPDITRAFRRMHKRFIPRKFSPPRLAQWLERPPHTSDRGAGGRGSMPE